MTGGMICASCRDEVPLRKFCDRCGTFQKRRPHEWKDVIAKAEDCRSHDILFAAAPPDARSEFFAALREKGEHARIGRVLALIKDKKPEDWAWLARGLAGEGKAEELCSIFLKIDERLWPAEVYAAWFDVCSGKPERKGEALRSLAGIRKREDSGEIFEAYYLRALGFEKEGRSEDAKAIYERFVNENIPYKDAFSRYMRLSGQAPGKSAKETARAAETRAGAASTSEKYEILRQIGSGGMGIVYEAVNVRLKKRVALKKMRPELSLNIREKQRFLAEAQRVAELHHPNIVDIYDIYEAEDAVYLVFELIEGHGVDEILNRGEKFEVAEAVRIASAACLALEYAHENRVIN